MVNRVKHNLLLRATFPKPEENEAALGQEQGRPGHPACGARAAFPLQPVTSSALFSLREQDALFQPETEARGLYFVTN